MNKEELICGLEYLLKESKVASAKIEYSYELDRLKRRVSTLEEEMEELKKRLQ